MTDQIAGSMSAIKINANQVEESEDESDHEGLVRHHATCDNCEKVRLSCTAMAMGPPADTQSPSTAFVTDA